VGVPKKLDIAFHILFKCLIVSFGAKTIIVKSMYVENPAGLFFFFFFFEKQHFS